ELGYPGSVPSLMGLRLVQRRRPQLDDRLPEQRFREAAASPAAAFFVPAILEFVRAFEGDRSRVFAEKLIRKKASAGLSPLLLFRFPIPCRRRETPQNCCENATHPDNICRNGQNA